MRYVIERYKQEQRDLAYRIYVTDSLRALMGNENNRRFADFLEEADTYGKPKVREKTPEEIITGIRKKLGGKNGSNSI